jgi:hypothetical protein
MTCIAAIAQGGHVHMGGDTVGVDTGHGRTSRRDDKVFRLSVPGKLGALPMVVGFTTSFRMGQLLRYRLQVPALPAGVDVHRYLATDFVDAVRETFTRGGWRGEGEDKADQGGVFLVGVAGRLFEIEADYQVGEPVDGYAAIGCAQNIALGSLWMTRGTKHAPAMRLHWALSAAAHHSSGVAPPFTYVDTRATASIKGAA